MFINAEETAKKLNMHPAYVRRLLAQGKIPGYKRGQWFVDSEELDKYIRGGSNQPAGDAA